MIAYLGTQHCCLSAQELFDGLRAEGRAVGIASVYRALDQLAELRLVHRVDLGHGLTRYERRTRAASITTTSSATAAGRSRPSTTPASSER